MNNLIADLAVRLKTAYGAKKNSISIPYSNSSAAICNLLARNGYISGFKVSEEERRKIIIFLKYFTNQKLPALTGIKIVSKPGRRSYIGVNEIRSRLGDKSLTMIISTSQCGIVTGLFCVRKNIGGEHLMEVY